MDRFCKRLTVSSESTGDVSTIRVQVHVREPVRERLLETVHRELLSFQGSITDKKVGSESLTTVSVLDRGSSVFASARRSASDSVSRSRVDSVPEGAARFRFLLYIQPECRRISRHSTLCLEASQE